jgi:uncharacterized membrane protein YdjX (TVP38/TMEM64 family)
LNNSITTTNDADGSTTSPWLLDSTQQESSKAITIPEYTSSEVNYKTLLAASAVLAAAFALFKSPQFSSSMTSLHLPALVEATKAALANPGLALDRVIEAVDAMGPMGIVYFGLAYAVAEILAIPAVPLTASAGYLFGVPQGTAVVLLSASIAAVVSFAIGRTLLREYVEDALVNYPKFAKLDRAIGREGFKLMLLLRLSPVFPFALSNYLYGASSIKFSAFFWGTLLGFTPGTLAYVYTGFVGKALSGGAADVYPWYIYAGGLTVFASLLKILADTAAKVVEEIEAEEDDLIR